MAIWRAGQDSAFRDDLDAGLLVVVLGAQPLEVLGGAQQSDAAARHDTLFNCRTGRMHRIIHAILALLDFGFSRAADADHRDNRLRAWPDAPAASHGRSPR